MDNMGIVTIDCADRVGLVSETAGILFDLGANMEDTVFRVFGDQAKLTAVCDFPSDLSLDELQFSLIEQLGLGNEEVNVAPYTGPTLENPSESITHRIIVSGGDRPGLIARLSEVFVRATMKMPPIVFELIYRYLLKMSGHASRQSPIRPVN